MSEARTRLATLDDVREEVSSLFCQFAYTGDYETPSCNILQTDPIEGSVVAFDASATVPEASA